MSKRTDRLTESDLHNIIKESVEKVLNEVKAENEPMTNDNMFDILHGGYPRHDFQQYREENSELFDKWINKLTEVYLGFDDCWLYGSMKPIKIAKSFGYTKSYKRLLIAKENVEKAIKLLKAAKQDMFAEYVNKDYNKKTPNYSRYGYEGSGFGTDGISTF